MPRRRPDESDTTTPVRVEVVPRRGLNQIEAARYVGISTTKFDELVREGQMPQPFRIGSRTIWDLRKLDAAFDELSGAGEDSFNGWDTAPIVPAELKKGSPKAKGEAVVLMSEEYPGYHHVYTPESLAERWRCSGTHVRNMIKRGELLAVKYGGKLIRISAAAVVAYETANTVAPIR